MQKRPSLASWNDSKTQASPKVAAVIPMQTGSHRPSLKPFYACQQQ